MRRLDVGTGDKKHVVFPTWNALMLCLVLINSTGLVWYNRYLLPKFPYPDVLVTIHFVFSFTFSTILYAIEPNWFPFFYQDQFELRICLSRVFKFLLPITTSFYFSVYLASQAFQQCSLPFIQLMKDGNLLLAYTLSLSVKTDRWDWCVIKLISIFIIWCTFRFKDDMTFTVYGIILQFGSQLCETGRITLQHLMLSENGFQLDVMSYVMLESAASALFLVMKTCAVPPQPEMYDSLRIYALPILGNAIVAFALNISIALYLKYSTPATFMLTSTIRDILLTLTPSFFASTSHSKNGYIEVVGQTVFVLIYLLIRIHPSAFKEGSITTGIHNSFHRYINAQKKTELNPVGDLLLGWNKIEKDVAGNKKQLENPVSGTKNNNDIKITKCDDYGTIENDDSWNEWVKLVD